MEKMKYITFLNILAKLIFTVPIFFLVKNQGDYLNVPLLNSIGFLTAGILALAVVRINFGIKFILPTLKALAEELREGIHIFMSTLAISLFTTSNAFILGIFTNNTIVGYYSAGEKTIRAFHALLVPLNQTIYPHISSLVSKSKEKALNFVRRITKFVGGTTFAISTCVLIFAPQISNIILGSQYKRSIPVIQILAFIPFVKGLSDIFGFQVMLNFGLKKVFAKILMIASLLNILMAIILVQYFQHIGIAISVLMTESFVTLSILIYLKIKGFALIQFGSQRENSK